MADPGGEPQFGKQDLVPVTVTRVHRIASKFGITELFEQIGAEEIVDEEDEVNKWLNLKRLEW